MKSLDFTAYTDKLLPLKYIILVGIMWVVIFFMYLSGFKMMYLVGVSALVTFSAWMLYGNRIETCFKDKYSEIETAKNNLSFKFKRPQKQKTYPLSKIKKVYLTEIPRRGKKFNPYHFFLAFEFSQKNVLESTEIPAEKIFQFIDDFNSFTESNNLKLQISNLDKIEHLLGKKLYKYLSDLHNEQKNA